MDINENGILTLGETEICENQVENKCSHANAYIIPKKGDVLVSIRVNGEFSQAKLFQYSWNGYNKIVYDTLRGEGEMYPFPDSGFPLLQVGKNIYLDVYDAQNVHVTATYALLKKEDRQKLANYVFPGSRDGVRVIHKSGDIYQVTDVYDYGFSTNTLEKLYIT
jgi:hypothetical protein